MKCSSEAFSFLNWFFFLGILNVKSWRKFLRYVQFITWVSTTSVIILNTSNYIANVYFLLSVTFRFKVVTLQVLDLVVSLYGRHFLKMNLLQIWAIKEGVFSVWQTLVHIQISLNCKSFFSVTNILLTHIVCLYIVKPVYNNILGTPNSVVIYKLLL